MLLRMFRQDVRIRIVVLVTAFAVALSIFIVTVGAQEQLVQERGFSFLDQQTLIDEGLELRPDTVDLFVVIPSFRLSPPGGSGAASSSLDFTLDDIGFYTYDSSDELDADILCIDAIHVAPTYTDPTAGEFFTGTNLLDSLDPLCYDLGQAIVSDPDTGLTIYLRTSTRNATTADLYDRLLLRAFTENRIERYPYDGFNLQVVLQFSYRVLSGDTEVNAGTARPFTVWLFETSGERNWNIDFVSQRGEKNAPGDMPLDLFNFLPTGVHERVSFTFERPLIFRLMYPFPIAAMLLIIGLLPFVETLDGLMEITAAILFGIFGLRQVMTLPNSQGQTILDVIFIGLYVVLAFTFFVIIVTYRGRGRLRRGAGVPLPASEAADEAT